MLSLEALTLPMQPDQDGVIRVGKTRVRLDTVIFAFNEGYTAEEIVSQYPVLKLADVYAVLAYYLNNRQEVETYLQERAEFAIKVRANTEAKPEYQLFQERILARRQQNCTDNRI